MNRYEYRCFEDADDEWYQLTSSVGPLASDTGLRILAQQAARDYFHEHDGWESKWPRNFELRFDGKSLGCFNVELEAVPEFIATPGEP